MFTNNRTQAVRLPAELRHPEGIKLVTVRALGNERIMSPLSETWNSFFIGGSRVSEDFMEARESQHQQDREDF